MKRGLSLTLLALGALAACKDTPQKTDSPAKSAAVTSVAAPVASAAPPPRVDPNVILITVDCLRADMPWAGYARPIAPRLTALAEKAVVYTHAYSASSYTSMSLGGLLSGKLPGELKRDGYFFGAYAKDNLFFPEAIQAAKLKTLSAHAHGYFKDAGFNQGFDQWELVPNLKWNNLTDENVTSPELEAIAEKQLGTLADGDRFFAWYHFLDPHDGYMSHDGIDWGKTMRDRYDAEVTFTDQSIGKLLDFIASKPWGPKTVIVVTADHGESFGEHGRFLHGFELWENLVRVPLFFVVPGVAPKKIDVSRSALDLAPTILELLGVPPAEGLEGTSLVPELRAGCDAAPCAERDIAIDLPATSDNEKRRALIHGKRKAISFGATGYVQLFDLAADPDEAHPIVAGPDYQEAVTRMRDFEKNVKDVLPTTCRDACLAGGYQKSKDGGTQ